MYNYFYRQNTTPMPPKTPPTQLPIDTQKPEETQMTPAILTKKQPYSQMQDIVTDIVELYHTEIKNMNMYQPLLTLTPNMEQEEIILDIIDHTSNNILYLEQMYLGLTGDTIKKLAMPSQESPNLSYVELLKNTLFSKTDTLEQYEKIYRLVPIQPYKDVLFEVIMSQLKDATSCNYLISVQPQPQV